MTRTKILADKNKRRKEIRDKIRCTAICTALVLTTCAEVKLGAATSDTYIDSRYVQYCEQIGDKYGICPEVLEALIETESGGKANAIGKSNDTGLCQIIPKCSKYTQAQLLDPKTNIDACAEILLEYCEKYEDMGMALVAYNCGAYSKTFKKCLKNGTYTDYAEKILKRSYALERVHGK